MNEPEGKKTTICRYLVIATETLQALKTQPERLSGVKHSSLFNQSNSNDENKFCNLGPVL